MPQIFITSGTSYTLPADWNPSNNTVECYGAGANGNTSAYDGGGGGAYSRSTNVNVGAGATIQIGVGVPGSSDTWFNATSLANAVSKGVTLSCGAQGANGSTGGQASAGCGVVKFTGGNGGGTNTYGGGGGGASAGPNGNGGWGGAAAYTWHGAGVNGYGGGGGGGANNGASGFVAGSQGGVGTAGSGGNNRNGYGGGAYGTYPSGTTDGGAGTDGGGGGGGMGNGGVGSGDRVYGAGNPGPSGGGGGGAGYSNGAFWSGGNAWSGPWCFGGGGGGGPGGAGGYASGGIVLTYVSAAPASRAIPSSPILPLLPPTIIAARTLRSADPPPTKMDWWRQPIDQWQSPPNRILFRSIGIAPNVAPNPTPQYKPPWLQWPELLRHPVAGLDYRQQFPGKRPFELHADLREGYDTVSTGVFPIQVNDPVNVSLIQYDAVVSIVTPAPELGGADDIIRRVKLLLPKGWWNDVAPIRDAIIGGVADVAAWSYGLVRYAKKQTRVAWATDFWLDIVSKDYFRFELSRKVNEPDEKFRLRIQKELIRERVTRQGMIDALTDFTGKVPYVFEPWNPGDCGAWDLGIPAFDIAGHWGDTCLPAQSFVNVVPPGAGIPGAPGWDIAMGWDVGGMWGDMSLIAGSITDADVYATINKTRPTGAIVWTQLFPPAGPMPLPVAPGPTPNFAPPLMNQVVVPPGAQRYSIATSVTEGLL